MTTKIGQTLKIIRIKHSEVMFDMAKKLGVTSSYLSAVETGKRAFPEHWLEKIVDLYNLTAEEKSELEEAAIKSSKSIKLNLSNSSEASRELAVAFARKFNDLDEDTIRSLRKTLKECTGGKNN